MQWFQNRQQRLTSLSQSCLACVRVCGCGPGLTASQDVSITGGLGNETYSSFLSFAQSVRSVHRRKQFLYCSITRSTKRSHHGRPLDAGGGASKQRVWSLIVAIQLNAQTFRHNSPQPFQKRNLLGISEGCSLFGIRLICAAFITPAGPLMFLGKYPLSTHGESKYRQRQPSCQILY